MKYFLLLFFIFCACGVFSQKVSGSIKGILIDSVSGSTVEGATVSVVKQKDSSLVAFVISDEQGKFMIHNLQIGEYRLLVSHLSYRFFSTPFLISQKNQLPDLGTISLVTNTNLLEEVEVKTEVPPVTLKGDTTEFNAGSFKTKPNAPVEDLLKKLPGMTIDKDGTIKLNGQKIKNVLVDGKKFFGANPKTATRNLPADAIDKVQVFDKMSDQAELSGFDDGNGSKTINLTFKKDHKKGSFGKLNAGGGTEERYSAKGNVNKFMDGMQLSLLGSLNNVNDDVNSISDISDFSSLQNKMNRGNNNEHNNVKFSSENSIITAGGGGINYNDFNNPKRDIHGDYLFNYSNPVAESGMMRQFFLPDTSWTYLQNQHAYNSTTAHAANGVYDKKFNDLESFKITASANWQDIKSNTKTDYQTFEENGNPANAGFSNNQADTRADKFSTEMLYRKKFRRKGTTFSINLSLESSGMSGSGQQLSENNFFSSGLLLKKDTIDQRNLLNRNSSGYTLRSVFTEAVFRSSLLELSAAKSYSSTNDETAVYNFNNATGNYDALNTVLSNRFKSSSSYYNGGARLRIQTYKSGFSFGAVIQQSDLNSETPEVNKSTIKKSFLSVLPNAKFKYSFNRFKSISFVYATSVNAPNGYQLQPLIDNSDPLNIKKGNPDLNQEYNHILQFSFATSHPYNGSNLRFDLGFTSIRNKIVSSDSINNLGIKKSTLVNSDGTYYLFSNLNAGCKVQWLKGYLSLGTYAALSNSKMFVNGITNVISNLSISPELKLTSALSDEFNFGMSASFTYNKAVYSIQPAADNDFTTQRYGVDLSWELPGKWFFGTDFTYTINNGLPAGYNKNIPLLNASISKFVLANNKGELKLSVADLFNNNLSVSRNANQNFIEDTHSTILKRYFLLSFTYSLSRVGLGSSASHSTKKF